MSHIKEIKLNGVCTCCNAPKEIKELTLNPTSGSYIRLTIGNEQIEVSAKALISAVETISQ